MTRVELLLAQHDRDFAVKEGAVVMACHIP
jgi:hypothetical protein